jgi:hypothetical protein
MLNGLQRPRNKGPAKNLLCINLIQSPHRQQYGATQVIEEEATPAQGEQARLHLLHPAVGTAAALSNPDEMEST